MRHIVVTDLDGTLLDRHTYRFTGALSAIEKLNQHQIPIILNSSKTVTETQDIRKQLYNQEPFVCENGGLVCGLKPLANEADSEQKLDIQCLGMPRKEFLGNLAKIKQELDLNYRGFAEATVEEIVAWTGLDPIAAKRAMARELSEPLLWQDDQKALTLLENHLKELNLQCTQGEKFNFVTGNFNKASCFADLKNYYSRLWQEEVVIVAIGSSQPNLPMLEEADISIIIPNQEGDSLKPNCQYTFWSSQQASKGWQEGINFCFKHVF